MSSKNSSKNFLVGTVSHAESCPNRHYRCSSRRGTGATHTGHPQGRASTRRCHARTRADTQLSCFTTTTPTPLTHRRTAVRSCAPRTRANESTDRHTPAPTAVGAHSAMQSAACQRAQTRACSSACQCVPRQVRGPAWSEPRRAERVPRHARPGIGAARWAPPCPALTVWPWLWD